MKKRIPVIALAAILLTACGEPKEENDSQADTSSAVTTAVSDQNSDALTEDDVFDSAENNKNTEKAKQSGTKAVASGQKGSDPDSADDNVLPGIGDDGAEQVPPADSAPDSASEFIFDEDNVIELPIIPIN